jgi:hypothetical protein
MSDYSELKRLALDVIEIQKTEDRPIGDAWSAFEAAAEPAVVLGLIAEVERLREVMSCVVNEIPRYTHRAGNAPGHCHAIPGVWDRDNGDKAGTECGWCKVWNAAVAMSKEASNG